VRRVVGALPEGRIDEVGAAVEDDPVGVAQMLRELDRADQRRVGSVHCALPAGSAAVSAASQARASSSSSKTLTSAVTKSCDTQALQVSHWSWVSTAMRRKSPACWRENLISSHATSS